MYRDAKLTRLSREPVAASAEPPILSLLSQGESYGCAIVFNLILAVLSFIDCLNGR